MRREEYEIKDKQEILKVLDRCDVIRLGLYSGDYPYVVPVFFGWEEIDGEVFVYFHSAREGLKSDLLTYNNHVCIECDRFLGYHGSGCDTSADYESVQGFGMAEPMEGELALHGLERLMAHCTGENGLDARGCNTLPATQVYRIHLDLLFGKRRIHE